MSWSNPRRPIFRAILALAGVLLVAGCVFRQVREQQERIAAFARIQGEVRLEPPGPGTLVVFLVQSGPAGSQLVDHFALDEPGRFDFVAAPGTYAVGAFHDANRNLVYEPGEPLLTARSFGWRELAAGGRLTGISLVVPRQGGDRLDAAVDLTAVQAQTPSAHLGASLGRLTVEGAIASPDDARFDLAIGNKGMWRPLDFVFDDGPGIYFQGPYDPKRLPVLFVHGMQGTPRNFSTLAKSIDATRQQAWFFFYPSGAALERIGDHLLETMRSLRLRLGFQDVALVCHSMGGLVCRSFMLARQRSGGERLVRLFITIGTPYGGNAGAAEGAKHAPAAVRSWIDLDPSGAFLRGLFYTGDGDRQRLPREIPFHLVFGYLRGSMPGQSSDGVIPLGSSLRLEAQEEAVSVRGFDADHVGLLHDPTVVRHVTSLITKGG